MKKEPNIYFILLKFKLHLLLGNVFIQYKLKITATYELDDPAMGCTIFCPHIQSFPIIVPELSIAGPEPLLWSTAQFRPHKSVTLGQF